MYFFKCRPVAQHEARGIFGELLGIETARRWRDAESGESKTRGIQQRLDAGHREAVLLHVEEQVAALAAHEEIVERRHLREVSGRGSEKVAPATADVVLRRRIALHGDVAARRNDGAAAEFAVEPQH